jgi:cobalt-zinc-cadmium resistance protein CzcA
MPLMFCQTASKEWENPVLIWLSKHYDKLLSILMRHSKFTLAGAASILLAVFVFVVPRLGTEFLPYMDEGVIWVRANFPEGTSLQQTSAFGRDLRKIALSFQDVKFAAVQTGRNDSGTDPYPPSRIEMMIAPQPRDTWVQYTRKQELMPHWARNFV